MKTWTVQIFRHSHNIADHTYEFNDYEIARIFAKEFYGCGWAICRTPLVRWFASGQLWA